MEPHIPGDVIDAKNTGKFPFIWNNSAVKNAVGAGN
jgi:hypothetical protein